MHRLAIMLARAQFRHGSAGGARDVSFGAAHAPSPAPAAPAARPDLQSAASGRAPTIDDGLGSVTE
jgi:hypothetical protein